MEGVAGGQERDKGTEGSCIIYSKYRKLCAFAFFPPTRSFFVPLKLCAFATLKLCPSPLFLKILAGHVLTGRLIKVFAVLFLFQIAILH